MARPPRPPRFGPRFDRGPRWRAQQRRRGPGRTWGWLRYALGLALIALAWHAWNRADLRAAIGLPIAPPEQVTARFALCAERGRAGHCVIDGDTFLIGSRKIRVQGIDAPEIHGACPAESAAAQTATRALQAWLNAGPFTMEAADSVPRDQYGRELQRPVRGSDDLGAALIAAGHAQAFGFADGGGQRGGWC